MKIRQLFLSYLMVFLLLIAIMFPFFSWTLSVCNYPCRSMLSPEGLRWLFLHSSDILNYYWVKLIFVYIVCAGIVFRSGILTSRKKSRTIPLYLSIFLFFLFITILLFAAFHPQSPLLSFTGTISHSPFLYGLPFVFAWGISFIAVFFVLLCHNVSGIMMFCDLFVYGLSRASLWIIIVVLFAFIKECYEYVFELCV